MPRDRLQRAVGAARWRGLLLLPAAALLAPAAEGPAERFEHWAAAARQAGEAKDFAALARSYAAMAALRPGEAWIHRGLGLAHHMQGRHRDAVPALEKTLLLDASLPGAALYLGISYYRLNRFAEAAASLARAPEIDEKQHLAHYWLGAARRALGQYRQAIASLEQAARLNPEDIEGLHLLARAYAEYSDELHARLSQTAPASAGARLLAAKDLAADGAWHAALAAVDQAIAADAALAEARLLKQKILARQGRSYPEAQSFLQEYEEILRRGASSQVRRWRDLLDASPDHAGALYELGEIYARLSQRTAESLLELYPDSYRARLLRGEAFEKSARMEFDKALAEFRKAAALRPDAPGLQFAVGRVLWKMNRWDEASVHLARELDANPHHGTAHFLLGKTHLRQNRPAEAVKHLRAAVKARPELWEARRSLAQALIKQGMRDEGIACYRSLLRERPDDASAHALLAAALRAAGRLEEAKASARAAQRLRAAAQPESARESSSRAVPARIKP